MIKSKVKKPGPLLSIVLILSVLILFVGWQVLANAIMYAIFTWPIWLGQAFDICLEFTQKSTLNKVIVTASFTLVGLTLFKLKKGALIIFGAIEFVGGVFIFWGNIISPSPFNLTNAIALGAGLFLVVQGTEDYIKGNEVEKDKKKMQK